MTSLKVNWNLVNEPTVVFIIGYRTRYQYRLLLCSSVQRVRVVACAPPVRGRERTVSTFM